MERRATDGKKGNGWKEGQRFWRVSFLLLFSALIIFFCEQRVIKKDADRFTFPYWLADLNNFVMSRKQRKDTQQSEFSFISHSTLVGTRPT